MPLFPDATVAFMPWIAVLSVIAIIYGALVAMVQKDVKSLVAFSSVSHMGFVMLGLFAFNMQGMQGAIMQMINHGVSTGALFLLVGMIYDRRHTRMIDQFGGIANVMPIYATFFLIVTFSSIGLPLTNGFIGEFLILLGAFKTNIWYGALAATGVILSAAYMLWMFQRVIFGKVTNPENAKLLDINWREKIILLPLIALIFWIGIYPKPFFDRIEPAAQRALIEVGQAASVDINDQFEIKKKATLTLQETEEAAK
jgi:NADH-quinone oxidoreductase subunit M